MQRRGIVGRGTRRARSRRPSGAYDPSTESGRFIDLWAAQGITVDGSTNVSAWAEQASGANFSQGTAASRPPYTAINANLGNRATVNFVSGGAAKLLTTTSLTSAVTTWTAYLFGRPTAATSQRRYFLDCQTGRLILVQSWEDGVGAPTAGGVGFYDDTGLDSIAADTAGAQVLTWVLNGTAGALGGVAANTGQVWRGTTSLGTAAYTARAWGGTTAVGGIYTSAGTTADVQIGRLLVFAGVHDAATRLRVQEWGADYYGITL